MGEILNDSSCNLTVTFPFWHKLLSDCKWECIWTAGRLIRKDTKNTNALCLCWPSAISKVHHLFLVFHNSPSYLGLFKISFTVLAPRYSYIALSNIHTISGFNKKLLISYFPTRQNQYFVFFRENTELIKLKISLINISYLWHKVEFLEILFDFYTFW